MGIFRRATASGKGGLAPFPQDLPDKQLSIPSAIDDSALRQARRRALINEPPQSPPVEGGATDAQPEKSPPPAIPAGVITAALRSGNVPAEWKDFLAVDQQGARNLKRFRVEDLLDLNLLQFDRPIRFTECEFPAGIDVSEAHVGALVLMDSEFSRLEASNFRTGGNLDLRGCKVEHYIDAIDAKIGGSIFAYRLKAREQHKSDGLALHFHRVQVGSSLIIREASITGTIDLIGAKIGGAFECSNTKIVNVKESAISAYGLTADEIYLESLDARGTVDIAGAVVARALRCSKAKFHGLGRAAFYCDSIRVKGDVTLYRAEAEGAVDFCSATIDGVLNCDAAEFKNPKATALNGDRLTVKGPVFLRHQFTSKGIVDFWGAAIGGSLFFYDGKFENTEKVGDFRPVAIKLRSTKIAGGLFFIYPLDENVSRVKRDNDGRAAIVGDVVLSGASAEEVALPDSQGLAKGCYQLDGFSYQRIGTSAHNTVAALLAWLQQQPPDDLQGEFRAQPWSQVVSVLREAGYESEARKIAIEREKQRARSATYPGWLWAWFLRITVLYGYSPWRPVLWSIACVIIGWITFDAASHYGYMAPLDGNVLTSKSWQNGSKLPVHYPPFDSPMYALDVFLPI